MRDMINDPELRALTGKLIDMCEDPGGIGDHVIGQHVMVTAELIKVYERGARERTDEIMALIHEHSQRLPDVGIKIADAIMERWPKP